MKIAIMSDSHENWNALGKAIEISNNENCEYLLFGGDLISPPGIAVLEKFKGLIKFVWGNNEAERVGIVRKMDSSKNMEMCGDVFEGTIDGIKIFMNHYPRFTELAAKSGEFDLCIHGHTHIYRQEVLGNTVLINPGEIQGYKTGQSTFIIFDTSTRDIKKVIVD